jgi:hypothetical protein
MRRRDLEVEILPQPDDTTCGPTCLHAVYRYFGDDLALDAVIGDVPQLKEGGTLAVVLACHALRRGYEATIYTYNLQIFDPTWFQRPRPNLRTKLRSQRDAKRDPKLVVATTAYLDFLDLGGRVIWDELTARLLRRHLMRQEPILTGLSATYLYQSAREIDEGGRILYEDVRGEPAGHFVVLSGYDRQARTVRVADPYLPNPMAHGSHTYDVAMDRLLASIFLGALTYDANLLVVRPQRGDARRRQ